MSENVKEITGYDFHEFINNPSFWINGIYPDDRQRSVDNFEDIVQKEHYSEIYRFQHKNGSYLWTIGGFLEDFIKNILLDINRSF